MDFVDFFKDLFNFFWMFSRFLDFLDFDLFFGFFFGFLFYFIISKLLLKITEGTTEHQKKPKVGKNSIKSFFFPQKLVVSLRSRLYLLLEVLFMFITGSFHLLTL